MKPFIALCIFFAALLGEPYLVEVEPMKQKLLSVLPAAIEDQKAIVEAMKNRARVRAGLREEIGDPAARKLLAERANTAEIEHWQSLRVLMLLEQMQEDQKASQTGVPA